MAADYWFARYRRPDGRPAKGIIPLNWKGRAVVAGFVVAMIAGGIAFVTTVLMTQDFVLGIVLFVVLDLVGAGTFLWAAVTKCDPIRPAADYLAERRRR